MKNLAIAYNVKRHNAKKMAKGGMCYGEGGEVMNEKMHPMHEPTHPVSSKEELMRAAEYQLSKEKQARPMADGGMIQPEEALKQSASYELGLEKQRPAEPKHLVHAIMMKRMAKGGMANSEDALSESDRYERSLEDMDLGSSSIDHDDNEEMPIGMGHKHDDFLSDEADHESPSFEAMAHGGMMEEEDPAVKRKGMVHRIMNSIRYGRD